MGWFDGGSKMPKYHSNIRIFIESKGGADWTAKHTFREISDVLADNGMAVSASTLYEILTRGNLPYRRLTREERAEWSRRNGLVAWKGHRLRQQNTVHRNCLKCERPFESSGNGNRLCGPCRMAIGLEP